LNIFLWIKVKIWLHNIKVCVKFIISYRKPPTSVMLHRELEFSSNHRKDTDKARLEKKVNCLGTEWGRW